MSVFPSSTDPLFPEKLAMMEDFGIFQMDAMSVLKTQKDFEKKASSLCQFEKTYYQHLMSQYISDRSPYRSLLLYHGLGSGKTCSAITIAETFLRDHRLYQEPEVWVISKKALKKSFEQEVFRSILLTTPEFLREQCTGDSYYQMIPDHASLSQEKLTQRIYKIIRSRYHFYGYEKFANIIQEYLDAGEGVLEEKIRDKVIIIDEAHNVRYLEGEGEEENKKDMKKIVEPLLKFLELGENNRLVLLSATPMFNEPEEILWLLSLLLINDKRPLLNPFQLPSFFTKNKKPNPKTFALIRELSAHYISYVRGSNPFTFASRVPPSLLGVPSIESVPTLTYQGAKIPKEEHKWSSYIRDGLVPSTLQGVQLKHLMDSQKLKIPSIPLLRQLNNITYMKKVTKETVEYVEGKEGIYSMFKKTEEGITPVQLEYIHPKEPILNPAFGKLGDYATKLQTFSQLLKKSEGVVVLYSNFVWGGLVPVAIMLEHMGFSRYGENDLLRMTNKVTERVQYPGVDRPSYCILSGENTKDIMGSSKIDQLLTVINDTTANANGKKIKVVLMSPVASEGLTFKNVREMHILEPWFHMNLTEQAIGRAIRHCSHSSLPLEERNVTVFLHTTVFPDNSRETPDLHAYRLSAMKHYEVQEVDRTIKENAIDCTLLRHVNYFPKELFEFVTTMKTSHGTVVPYHYGDEKDAQIVCKHTTKVPRDTRAFREESYASFLPTLQHKFRKVLRENLEKTGKVSYTYEELLQLVHPNREVAHRTIENSLYPYQLWDNYALIYHLQQFIVTQFKESDLRPTRLQIEAPDEEASQEGMCMLENVLEAFAMDPIEVATVRIYQALDYVCWKEFAEKVVTQPEKMSAKLVPILSILEKQGAFVLSNELPQNPRAGGKYIGYVQLFAKEDQFEVLLWDGSKFREAIPSEVEKIKKQRQHVPFPDPSKIKITKTIGFAQRYKNPKDPKSPYRFQLKLGLNNEKGKRTGIVCDGGIKKPDIEKELSAFFPLVDGNGNRYNWNISQLCFQFMLELYKAKRLWFPPAYKRGTQ